MTNRTRRASALFSLTLAAALLGPAPVEAQRRQQRAVSDVTSVVVVEVPVNVVADGQPLLGLTADDFEVLDGRKKLPIVGFEVIDLSTKPEGESAALRGPLPAAGRRHFLFLFDLAFSQPSAIARAREAARRIVASSLHPEDLAAVALYSLQQGPRVLLGFTPDRAQLLLALDTLGDPKLAKRADDPLGLVFAELTSPALIGARQGLSQELAGEVVEEFLEGIVDQQAKVEKKEMQGRVATMTRQMADLGRLLDTVEGRKFVVYLSEGFDDSLLVGRGAGLAGVPRSDESEVDISGGATGGTTTADRIARGEVADVDSDTMFGSGQVQNDLQAMLQEFKKANCTIQAVDIGGLRADGTIRGAAGGQNVLSTMASETGGEVVRNFNDLGQAMGRILDKTSVTYVLAVQPEDLKLDGAYHRLRVRLKESRRGADLQHRLGFYAPLPFKEQRGLERQLRTASELLGEEGGEIATAALVAPFRVASGKTYVPLLIEVDGPSLLEGFTADVLPLEIYAYALDSRGSVHDFFAQNFPLDLKQTGAALKQAGLKYYGHLDLDPGNYDVRVLVRNLETGRSSLSVVPLSVPDFAPGSPVVLPPLFPEAPGKWVMVREAAARQRNVPYPFLLKGEPFIPAARPVLPRQGESRVPLPAYNLGSGQVQVVARLTGSDGRAISGYEVTGVERVAAGGGAETLILTLRHSGVAPGDYTLQVEVTDPASGKKATASTPLVVAASG